MEILQNVCKRFDTERSPGLPSWFAISHIQGMVHGRLNERSATPSSTSPWGRCEHQPQRGSPDPPSLRLLRHGPNTSYPKRNPPTTLLFSALSQRNNFL